MVTCPKKGKSGRKNKHKREIQKTKHKQEEVNMECMEEQSTIKRNIKMQVTEGTS
jgi:hypothetical protein